MRNPKLITVVHTKTGYQVQFAWLVIGEYSNLEEARQFSISYPYWLRIEIRKDNIMIDKIDKVVG